MVLQNSKPSLLNIGIQLGASDGKFVPQSLFVPTA
jgi:hypothetical protein